MNVALWQPRQWSCIEAASWTFTAEFCELLHQLPGTEGKQTGVIYNPSRQVAHWLRVRLDSIYYPELCQLLWNTLTDSAGQALAAWKASACQAQCFGGRRRWWGITISPRSSPACTSLDFTKSVLNASSSRAFHLQKQLHGINHFPHLSDSIL